jgi:hypothetical protein
VGTPSSSRVRRAFVCTPAVSSVRRGLRGYVEAFGESDCTGYWCPLIVGTSRPRDDTAPLANMDRFASPRAGRLCQNSGLARNAVRGMRFQVSGDHFRFIHARRTAKWKVADLSSRLLGQSPARGDVARPRHDAHNRTVGHVYPLKTRKVLNFQF